MPSFGLTPVTGFPAATPDSFPRGIQFQFEGVDVGGTNISTFNVVAGTVLNLTVGVGEAAGTLTLTIPTVDPVDTTVMPGAGAVSVVGEVPTVTESSPP